MKTLFYLVAVACIGGISFDVQAASSTLSASQTKVNAQILDDCRYSYNSTVGGSPFCKNNQRFDVSDEAVLRGEATRDTVCDPWRNQHPTKNITGCYTSMNVSNGKSQVAYRESDFTYFNEDAEDNCRDQNRCARKGCHAAFVSMVKTGTNMTFCTLTASSSVYNTGCQNSIAALQAKFCANVTTPTVCNANDLTCAVTGSGGANCATTSPWKDSAECQAACEDYATNNGCK